MNKANAITTSGRKREHRKLSDGNLKRRVDGTVAKRESET